MCYSIVCRTTGIVLNRLCVKSYDEVCTGTVKNIWYIKTDIAEQEYY
jgi:hypothetical protein